MSKSINQFNAKGEKNGYWIENDGMVELYYKDGVRHGIYKSYSGQGHLIAFIKYNNDKEEICYFFGNYGELVSIQKDFGKNTIEYVSNGRKLYPPNKCYHISFHPNGVISREGLLLWFESSEMDDVIEFGEWKFYDESGKLIRTKVYK